MIKGSKFKILSLNPFLLIIDVYSGPSESEEGGKLYQARETYFQQIRNSRLTGIVDIFLRVLNNEDDELRIHGFKSFRTIFNGIIKEQTLETYQDSGSEIKNLIGNLNTKLEFHFINIFEPYNRTLKQLKECKRIHLKIFGSYFTKKS